MSLLRVLIPDAWPDEAEAHWAVLEKGKVINSGHSGPSAWPRTQQTEAVLCGTQVGWSIARLPQARGREQLKALPFAMEDVLLREPDSQHLTAAVMEGENWAVLVIARERLRRLTEQFKALGRPLDAAWSALDCLPSNPDTWTLVSDGTHWLMRSAPLRAVIDDAPTEAGKAPPILATHFLQARTQGHLPSTVVVRGIDKEAVRVFAAPNVEWELHEHWHWHAVPKAATNLLHDEFSPPHARNRLLKRLRTPILLIVAVGVAHLLLGSGSAALRLREFKDLRARVTQIAATQLPGRALQDPVLQLHRELQTERTRHGMLADDDALSLLGELATALGSDATNALQSLHYESSSLVVTLAKPLDMNALKSRLETHGIQATQRGDNVLVIQRGAMQ